MDKTKMKTVNINKGGAGGAVYFFGLVGALIYFLPQAVGFNEIIIGILKSLVWPGIFVFKVFTFLKV